MYWKGTNISKVSKIYLKVQGIQQLLNGQGIHQVRKVQRYPTETLGLKVSRRYLKFPGIHKTHKGPRYPGGISSANVRKRYLKVQGIQKYLKFQGIQKVSQGLKRLPKGPGFFWADKHTQKHQHHKFGLAGRFPCVTHNWKMNVWKMLCLINKRTTR